MSIQVELVDDAIEDLERYAASGNMKLFLKKLVRLERDGISASEPLGRGLARYRKIVVGDRDWRIVLTANEDESVATVWVIGDRADSACYEQAEQRIAVAAKRGPASSQSLAAAMLRLIDAEKSRRQRSRKAGRKSR